jgi:hypothetical protein
VKSTVNVSLEDNVVVTETGDKYHLPSTLPWHTAKCGTTLPADRTVSRDDAENDGYAPCTKASCFGTPTSN